ncbi:hypothetical protein QTV44_002536 [Vibrio vulnificus]|nr:hypothetical protein [Vibrio vulnificus]
MPTFNLTARITISVSTTIKAPTLEEAIERSKDLPVYHQSEADGIEEVAWVAEEMDGSAYDIQSEGA